VSLSKDGKFLFATGAAEHSLVVFRRDLATGALHYVGAEIDGVNDVDGLFEARWVDVSPDNAHVYVAGLGDARNGVAGKIAVFALLPELPGDYNYDNIVDVADYTAWRDALGAPAGTLPNDPNGGVIDIDQYNTWKDHFGETIDGQTITLGDPSDSSTPEPTSAALLMLASIGAWLAWRSLTP